MEQIRLKFYLLVLDFLKDWYQYSDNEITVVAYNKIEMILQLEWDIESKLREQ